MGSLSIDALVVIGGPSTVGKTTLLGKLRMGQSFGLGLPVNPKQFAFAQYANGAELEQIAEDSIPTLVVHYDFLSRYTNSEGFQYLPKIMQSSQQVIVVTLCAPVRLIVQRHLARTDALEVLPPSPNRLTHLRNFRKKIEFCKNPINLIKLYQLWSECLVTHGVTEHYWMNTSHDSIPAASHYDAAAIESVLQS